MSTMLCLASAAASLPLCLPCALFVVWVDARYARLRAHIRWYRV